MVETDTSIQLSIHHKIAQLFGLENKAVGKLKGGKIQEFDEQDFMLLEWLKRYLSDIKSVRRAIVNYQNYVIENEGFKSSIDENDITANDRYSETIEDIIKQIFKEKYGNENVRIDSINKDKNGVICVNIKALDNHMLTISISQQDAPSPEATSGRKEGVYESAFHHKKTVGFSLKTKGDDNKWAVVYGFRAIYYGDNDPISNSEGEPNKVESIAFIKYSVN
ncbi:MAG: hypothetical protein Fur009_3560 [Candidatus Microgenomates bacterium]